MPAPLATIPEEPGPEAHELERLSIRELQLRLVGVAEVQPSATLSGSRVRRAGAGPGQGQGKGGHYSVVAKPREKKKSSHKAAPADFWEVAGIEAPPGVKPRSSTAGPKGFSWNQAWQQQQQVAEGDEAGPGGDEAADYGEEGEERIISHTISVKQGNGEHVERRPKFGEPTRDAQVEVVPVHALWISRRAVEDSPDSGPRAHPGPTDIIQPRVDNLHHQERLKESDNNVPAASQHLIRSRAATGAEQGSLPARADATRPPGRNSEAKLEWWGHPSSLASLDGAFADGSELQKRLSTGQDSCGAPTESGLPPPSPLPHPDQAVVSGCDSGKSVQDPIEGLQQPLAASTDLVTDVVSPGHHLLGNVASIPSMAAQGSEVTQEASAQGQDQGLSSSITRKGLESTAPAQGFVDAMRASPPCDAGGGAVDNGCSSKGEVLDKIGSKDLVNQVVNCTVMEVPTPRMTDASDCQHLESAGSAAKRPDEGRDANMPSQGPACDAHMLQPLTVSTDIRCKVTHSGGQGGTREIPETSSSGDLSAVRVGDGGSSVAGRVVDSCGAVPANDHHSKPDEHSSAPSEQQSSTHENPPGRAPPGEYTTLLERRKIELQINPTGRGSSSRRTKSFEAFSDPHGGPLESAESSGSPHPRSPLLDLQDRVSFGTIGTAASDLRSEAPQELVQHLVQELLSESLEHQSRAAERIRILTKVNADARVELGQTDLSNRTGSMSPGLIPALVAFLHSAIHHELHVEPASLRRAQEMAAFAILNLGINNDKNKAAIVAAGAVPELVELLRGKAGAKTKEAAVAALLTLSCLPENHAHMGSTRGTISQLVHVLRRGSKQGCKDALTALINLSISMSNRQRVIRAGAVRVLTRLLATGDYGESPSPDDPPVSASSIREKCAALLYSLSSAREGRDAIAGTNGTLAVLCDALDSDSGSEKEKENAAATLWMLCGNSAYHSQLVKEEGVVPALIALSVEGSPRAQGKARLLLSHLAAITSLSSSGTLQRHQRFPSVSDDYCYLASESEMENSSSASDSHCSTPATYGQLHPSQQQIAGGAHAASHVDGAGIGKSKTRSVLGSLLRHLNPLARQHRPPGPLVPFGRKS